MKDILKRVKRYIFANYIFIKRPLTRICKELSKLNDKKTKCPIKKWAKKEKGHQGTCIKDPWTKTMR